MSNVVNTFVQNSTGMVELNRPKALNSLNQEMIDLVQEALTTWADDDQVQQVLIYSSSERAFCAGGDVRAVRESVLEGDVAAGDKYFIDEFRDEQHVGNLSEAGHFCDQRRRDGWRNGNFHAWIASDRYGKSVRVDA